MHSSLQVENGGTNFLQENAWLLGNGYIRGTATPLSRDISYFTLIPANFTTAWIKRATNSRFYLAVSELFFFLLLSCFHELLSPPPYHACVKFLIIFHNSCGELRDKGTFAGRTSFGIFERVCKYMLFFQLDLEVKSKEVATL